MDSCVACRPAVGVARVSSPQMHRLPRAMSLWRHPPQTRLPSGLRHGRSSIVAKCMSSSSSQSRPDDLVRSKNEHNPVVLYSKSWCPYCSKVKGLFKKLGVKVVVVELDELVEEGDVQAALKRMTGQSTVPNVFIGGKHVGGCDDTHRLHSQGELIPMLQRARAQMHHQG